MGTYKKTEEKWQEVAKSLNFTDEQQMLTSLYGEGYSIREISKLLKCSTGVIQQRFAKYGIKKRGRGGMMSSVNHKYTLFHVDQRVVVYTGLIHCARWLGVSPATLYKYKRYKITQYTYRKLEGQDSNSVGRVYLNKEVR
jgi:hypothetical protein